MQMDRSNFSIIRHLRYYLKCLFFLKAHRLSLGEIFHISIVLYNYTTQYYVCLGLQNIC